MVRTVGQGSLQADQRIASQHTVLHGLADALFNCRPEVLRNRTAEDALCEDEILIHAGLEVHLDVTILAMTARLLLVLAFNRYLFADLLAVRHDGLGQIDLNAELVLELGADDIQMDIAHARDQHLLGLGVVLGGEGRVFVAQTSQTGCELFFVALVLGRDALCIARLGRLMCGDSRCYVFNGNSGFCRLSKDHSYVQDLVDQGKLDPENAFDHPYSNIITRCLGDPTNRSNPDFRSYNLKDGDTLLLCSDGLCGLCHDEEIMQIIEENQDDLMTCKDRLIEAALEAGGYDNITIVLCHIMLQDTEPKAKLNNTVFSKPNHHKIRKILLLLLVLALAAGFYLYRNPQQYAKWKTILYQADTVLVTETDTTNTTLTD